MCLWYDATVKDSTVEVKLYKLLTFDMEDTDKILLLHIYTNKNWLGHSFHCCLWDLALYKPLAIFPHNIQQTIFKNMFTNCDQSWDASLKEAMQIQFVSENSTRPQQILPNEGIKITISFSNLIFFKVPKQGSSLAFAEPLRRVFINSKIWIICKRLAKHTKAKLNNQS